MEEFIKDNWLSLAIVVVQVLWGWVLWSLKKQFVSVDAHGACQSTKRKRLGTLEVDLGGLSHRLDIVERDVKALPTVQGINLLSIELEKVRGELVGFRSEMTGQREFMKRTERQISLLIENELRGARSE